MGEIERILSHALTRMTAPSVEGAFWGSASAEAGFCACGHDQRTEPVWRLCDRPLETFARPLPEIGWRLALAGRGGSISRRDHNQLTEERVQLSWVRKLVGKLKFIPSYSSGGGPGEALLLEKRPPPEFSLS